MFGVSVASGVGVVGLLEVKRVYGLKFSPQTLGWHTVDTQCEAVPNGIALDVEIRSCEC